MISVELTERQADITRTVAVLVDNAANQRCEYQNDVALLIREDDPMFMIDATRTLLLGLVIMATACGITGHPVVQNAKNIVTSPRIPPDSPDGVRIYLDAAHHGAHFIYAMKAANMGEDIARELSREIVNRFAAGDYGDDVTVVPE